MSQGRCGGSAGEISTCNASILYQESLLLCFWSIFLPSLEMQWKRPNHLDLSYQYWRSEWSSCLLVSPLFRPGCCSHWEITPLSLYHSNIYICMITHYENTKSYVLYVMWEINIHCQVKLPRGDDSQARLYKLTRSLQGILEGRVIPHSGTAHALV